MSLTNKDLDKISKLISKALDQNNKDLKIYFSEILDTRLESHTLDLKDYIDETLEPIKENQKFILNYLQKYLQRDLPNRVKGNTADIEVIKQHLNVKT